MRNQKILLADNDPDFLETCTEFLESNNYKVLKALNPKDAQYILEEDWVHLAILDVRLVNDEDEKDISGLTLAKKSSSSIPIIMLTKFQTWEAVRESLGVVDSDRPPAVDFVAKQEGLEELLRRVQRALTHRVRINWKLDIDWNVRDRFSLVSIIKPGLENEHLLSHAEEFEHLLRCLFFEQNYIKLYRLLWQYDGRIALIGYNFRETGFVETFIVVCGTHDKLTYEARQFKEFAPKAPSDTGTILSSQAETTHFAANAYILANAEPANIHSLHDLYRIGPEKLFKNALTTLFEKTLAGWHQDNRIVENKKTLLELYCDRLKLSETHLTRPDFEVKVAAILRQIPILGATIELKNGILNVQFSWQTFTYPDPIPLLYQGFAPDYPVLLNTSGTLSGENIITDTEGRTWLTDFADAGLAPLLWNYTALEAAIRLDWVETDDLQRLHEMEHCLAMSRFNRFDMNLVEPVVKKPLRAIQSLRQLASLVVGKDETPYHVGIFLQAASRIAAYDPDNPCMSSELACLTHALLTMAILSEKIAQDNQHDSRVASERDDLHIDEQGIAWVRGMRLAVRGQSHDLLLYMYSRAGHVCKREEIAKHVFDIESYQNLPSKRKKAEENRMNAAIRRLREKIEDNPDHPRYLLTEPGVGYRLVRTSKT